MIFGSYADKFSVDIFHDKFSTVTTVLNEIFYTCHDIERRTLQYDMEILFAPRIFLK